MDAYGNVCLVFNMLDAREDRVMHFFNTTSSHLIALRRPEGWESRTEKNWIPLVWVDRIIFTYSWSPLAMVSCDFHSGRCESVHELNSTAIEINMIHGGTK